MGAPRGCQMIEQSPRELLGPLQMDVVSRSGNGPDRRVRKQAGDPVRLGDVRGIECAGHERRRLPDRAEVVAQVGRGSLAGAPKRARQSLRSLEEASRALLLTAARG